MAFSIPQYAKLRPTLWHLTHRENLNLIRKSRILMPADRSSNSERPRTVFLVL